MLLNKRMTISIAGKGGTGKTSLTALLLRSLLEGGSDVGEVLLVDADPANNIPDIMGVKRGPTIGMLLDRKKGSVDPESGVDCQLLRDEILASISQADGFDYLVMGRPTGKGCYCYINTMLKQMLDEALKLYDLVMIDFDAGLEHFSRQTDSKSDVLLVVTDPSQMGFETARRIMELTDEVGSSYSYRFLVGSRFTPDTENLFFSIAGKTGLRPLGIIPFDQQLLASNLEGRSIFHLDANSISYRSTVTLCNGLLKVLANNNEV